MIVGNSLVSRPIPSLSISGNEPGDNSRLENGHHLVVSQTKIQFKFLSTIQSRVQSMNPVSWFSLTPYIIMKLDRKCMGQILLSDHHVVSYLIRVHMWHRVTSYWRLYYAIIIHPHRISSTTSDPTTSNPDICTWTFSIPLKAAGPHLQQKQAQAVDIPKTFTTDMSKELLALWLSHHQKLVGDYDDDINMLKGYY